MKTIEWSFLSPPQHPRGQLNKCAKVKSARSSYPSYYTIRDTDAGIDGIVLRSIIFHDSNVGTKATSEKRPSNSPHIDAVQPTKGDRPHPGKEEKGKRSAKGHRCRPAGVTNTNSTGINHTSKKRTSYKSKYTCVNVEIK